MKNVLHYPGAKWRVADWIVSMMPSHKSYLEPFFGSGAVFFTKSRVPIETVNDLDGEIVNLFRVIREQPQELAAAVAMTPYSREEYEKAWELLDHGEMDEPDGVEHARLTLLRYWQSFGCRACWKGGWKRDVAGREAAYAVRNWNALPDWVMDAAQRLKDAQIEHTPALELIRRFRSRDVLIYADPPYLLTTRKGAQYRQEMRDEEHEELLRVLLEHPGPVMLSCYDNPLYDGLLSGRWEKYQHPAQATGGSSRIETLWVNFPVQMSLCF